MKYIDNLNEEKKLYEYKIDAAKKEHKGTAILAYTARLSDINQKIEMYKIMNDHKIECSPDGKFIFPFTSYIDTAVDIENKTIKFIFNEKYENDLKKYFDSFSSANKWLSKYIEDKWNLLILSDISYLKDSSKYNTKHPLFNDFFTDFGHGQANPVIALKTSIDFILGHDEALLMNCYISSDINTFLNILFKGMR